MQRSVYDLIRGNFGHQGDTNIHTWIRGGEKYKRVEKKSEETTANTHTHTQS